MNRRRVRRRNRGRVARDQDQVGGRLDGWGLAEGGGYLERPGALPEGEVYDIFALMFRRRCFSAGVLAPKFLRRNVLAPRRFGAQMFRRQDILAPDVLARILFVGKQIWH